MNDELKYMNQLENLIGLIQEPSPGSLQRIYNLHKNMIEESEKEVLIKILGKIKFFANNKADRVVDVVDYINNKLIDANTPDEENGKLYCL